MTSSTDRPTPDLFTLLGGLANTVKQRLAPAATDGYLRAELYSLASVLQLLSREGAALAAESVDERADLLATLESYGPVAAPPDATGPDGLRRLVAALPARGAGDPRMTAFLRRDLSRPLLGILTIDGTPPSSSSRAQEAPVLERSTEVLRERLAEYLAQAPFGGRMVAFERATEGYGAETIEVGIESGEGRSKVAVRVQWPDLPLSSLLQPVDAQASAVRAAGDAGVPVASVLDVVTDTGVVGAPFLVSRFVEGYVPTTWTAEGRAFTERLAAERAGEFLDVYSQIHAVDWRAAGLGRFLLDDDLERHQRARFDVWEAVYRESELRPDPLIEEVFAFLRSELRPWGEQVLIHGDLRPGNMIYAPDGSLRAVIDFDLAGVNDFHEELGHSLAWPWRDAAGRACGLLAPEELVAGYEERTGRSVVPEGLHFYQLQATFRRYLGFLGLARAWLDRGGDVRMVRAWMALRNDRIELGKLLGAA